MLYRTTFYKKIYTSLIFFACVLGVSNLAWAQFMDDFEDGTILTNPVWQGDINHFIINNENQLQLNAPATGESLILSQYLLPKDSLEIDVYFKMSFDPSDNNSSIIYLAMDNVNVQSAIGYYLKLGENGAGDNIKIYKSDNGVSTLLASCSLGAISKDPAQARVKIRIAGNGLWTVETNYQGGSLLVPDVEFMDTGIFDLPEQVYFGIFCKYTSTRLNNFFYDDLAVRTWVPDTVAPQLAALNVLNANTVELLFSERLDPVKALETSRYLANPDLGIPAAVTFGNEENIVVLTFDMDIESGVEYNLEMNKIPDLRGNEFSGTNQFFRAVSPEPGDLILNEILTDPKTGGEDFVELYNLSKKYLQLEGLVVRNDSKNEEKKIIGQKILKPGEYVAISKDTLFLKDTYKPEATAIFMQNDLPSLNISDAHIQIINGETQQRIVLDSFEYEESFHYSLLNETKGVSLERIFPEGPSNDPQNWHSASSTTNFGTPGYQNSNFKQISEEKSQRIFIPEKIFSPTGSNGSPYVLIHYDVEKSGYLLTIQIYDTEGFLVRSLLNNELIGQQGVVQWDGLDHEQIPVRTGWYIIASQLFHPDGDIQQFKHTVVAGGN